MTTSAEFLAKVNRTDDGCWLWLGSRIPKGYGNLRWHGTNRLAHHVAYELFVGPIPDDGLQFDHLCSVRHCVNPAHLERVTGLENVARARNHNREKTHCARGHKLAPGMKGVRRRCGPCAREDTARYRQRRAERSSL